MTKHDIAFLMSCVAFVMIIAGCWGVGTWIAAKLCKKSPIMRSFVKVSAFAILFVSIIGCMDTFGH